MKLLVAIDFSITTPRVLQEAALFSKLLSAELWLLHVAEPDPDFVGYELDPRVMRDLVAGKFRDEHQRLHAEADRFREMGVTATPILMQGRTAESILTEAGKLPADMIILGSHGHGAVYHLLVGSTCEGVLKKAKCPVLVVPARVQG